MISLDKKPGDFNFEGRRYTSFLQQKQQQKKKKSKNARNWK